MKEQRFRLYARPSFLEGVARLFDFNGHLNQYNTSRTEEEADHKAIESDWETVGDDLRTAIEKYRREHVRGESHG